MSAASIELLQARIAEIERDLSSRGSDDELIEEKKSHLQVIRMVRFVERHEIDVSKKVLTLPCLAGHGYYGYRIMIDNEVDDPNQWTVLEEVDGEPAEFVMGDKIITS